jgi:uncharacterized protein (TIGR03083 family)
MGGDWVDVRGMLGAERGAFVDLLGGLSGEEWAAATECPAWSVKGVALHILGDDLSLLARQRDAAIPGTFLYAENHPGMNFRGLLDGFNEQWVHAAQFLSPALVVEMLRTTGEWTADFYGTVDPHSPGEPVGFFGGFGGPSPYWQSIAREYVERWAHHHQILRALGRPRLGDELLAPAVDVIAAALAVHLPDLGASNGARVAIEITDLRTWALRRDADTDANTWRRDDDPEPPADATLTIAADQAATVFSRGLDRPEVEAAFTIRGDTDLGERLRAVVADLTRRPD